MRPVEPDEMFSVFHSLEAGVFEWVCGWRVANELLHGGMTRINGRPVHVTIVDRALGGVQLRAQVCSEPLALEETG